MLASRRASGSPQRALAPLPTVTPAPATESKLVVLTLGRFRVLASGREIRGIASHPMQAAVLAYLGVCAEVTRDRLVATFWPQRTDERARHALSQVLHKLRRDLGADWLDAAGDVLRLADSIEVDARELEDVTQRHDYEAALRLYSGPFLDGWRLRNASHDFELWLDTQRARFARLHVIACRNRARESEIAGDLAAAVGAMERWRESDPLDEAAHIELLQLLVRTGRRSEAVHRHREFLARLAAEDFEASADLSHRVETMLRELAPASIGAFDAPPVRSPIGDALPVVRSVRRDRVLVIPFENLTGDAQLDALGRLAADWIIEGLDRAAIGKIVPLLDGLRLLEAVGAPVGVRELGRMRALGQEAAAGTLVSGSYYRIGAGLEFRAQVVNLESGELLSAIDPVRASGDGEAEALPLVRERVLGLVATVLDTEWSGMPNSPDFGLPPPTYAAYKAYSSGLEHFVRQDFARAIPWFRQAMVLDPGFRRPMFLAAAAHENLGEWDVGAALTASMRSSAERLSPYDLQSLDWHEANLAGDLATAYELSSRRWRRYPGTLAQFVAAFDALRVNRPAEAIQVLQGLEPERGWLRDFHAYWDVLTAAHHMLSDHGAELAIARKGRAQSPTVTALLACEVRALAPMGMSSELEARLLEAADLPSQPGWSPARLILLAAMELRAHGHPRAARNVAERVVRVFEEDALQGPFAAAARGEVARALYLAERWNDAERVLEELASQFPQNAEYRGRLAVLAARRGNRAAALRRDLELQQGTRPYLFGRETAWRARVAAQLGDKDGAVRLLVRAFARGHAYGVELHADPDLEPLRTHEGFRRLLRPKG